MKPDWDKLGETFKGSSSVQIGDVDCTTDEGKPVCEANSVQGYPTIKYYNAETGKDGKSYDGGRSYDELEAFVKETLARKCDVKTKEDCSDEQKAYVEKQSGKAADALKAELVRLESLKDGDMKPDKKVWLFKRIAILKDMTGESGKGEL